MQTLTNGIQALGVVRQLDVRGPACLARKRAGARVCFYIDSPDENITDANLHKEETILACVQLGAL